MGGGDRGNGVGIGWGRVGNGRREESREATMWRRMGGESEEKGRVGSGGKGRKREGVRGGGARREKKKGQKGAKVEEAGYGGRRIGGK